MSVYPLTDPKDIDAVTAHLLGIRAIFQKNGLQTFLADNLLVLGRVFSFSRDAGFMTAFQTFSGGGADDQKLWRVYVYCWAARSALPLAGDFVECGVFRGLYSAVMTQHVEFQRHPKRLFLYDTFSGLPEATSTQAERDRVGGGYRDETVYQAVLDRFALCANVEVIRGVVPDVLSERAPERIALLHLDLNAAQAEVGALDALFDRVSPGGLILLDDFGRQENGALNEAHAAWLAKHGCLALEMPTGQGLVIKR
ncbi:MAG: methyltransferase [Alphaproteobacteria bacterium]|nr:methyltransferase [Alphaproteobacteria bacterium]